MEGFQEIVSAAPAGGSTAQSPWGSREFNKKANKTAIRRCLNLSCHIVVGRRQLVKSLLSGSSDKHGGLKKHTFTELFY